MPKAQAIKAKVNKYDYIKSKSLHTAKKIANKVKRQPTQWEKMFKLHNRYRTNNQDLQRTPENKNSKTIQLMSKGHEWAVCKS